MEGEASVDITVEVVGALDMGVEEASLGMGEVGEEIGGAGISERLPGSTSFLR